MEWFIDDYIVQLGADLDISRQRDEIVRLSAVPHESPLGWRRGSLPLSLLISLLSPTIQICLRRVGVMQRILHIGRWLLDHLAGESSINKRSNMANL